MPSTTLSVPTRRAKEILDITDLVENIIQKSKIQHGLVNVFVRHTTAAITTGEAIEGTDEDLLETLQKIIPAIRFRHQHDPSHAPDHMISSIVGSSVTIPIVAGRLGLGTWQRILFVESNGPRKRECVVTLIPAGE